MKNFPDFYDLWHTDFDKKEYSFYTQHADAAHGQILELGCGTGRLLIPILQDGYAIEGLDASQAMLDACKQKASKLGLQPTLYLQHIENLQLPKHYALIFSALETFQHIADREQAITALKKIYDHLEPNGTFVVYLSLPWLYAPNNAQSWRCVQKKDVNKDVYSLHEKSIHDPLAQLYHHAYEIKKNDTVIQAYETTIRWYAPHEFMDLLKHAGFKNIAMQAGYTGDGPFDALLFTAHK